MMEEQKKSVKSKTRNKMIWIAFVAVIMIVMSTIAVASTIDYIKKKSELASTNIQDVEENVIGQDEVIKQENLTDTSKMSAEE